MTARFAGSHCLDDRRRRRLAQESNDEETARSGGDGPGDGGAAEPGDSEVEPESTPMPDESLIPRSPWKIVLISLLLFGLGTGSLWLGHSEYSRLPGLEPILNLRDGRLPRFFGTLTLLLAAELSFVILWYRARSRKDFSGRYRLWGWAGCFWGIVCLSATTQVHLPLANILLHRWPVQCWRPETMFWLTPLAVGYLAVYHLLLLEMRHCRCSRILWMATFWWGLLAAGVQLGLEMFIPEATRMTVVTGITLLWQFLVSLTLLIHARFVVHVTNEAAPREPGWISRTCRLLYSWASVRAARMQARRNARIEQRRKKASPSQSANESTESRPVRKGTTASEQSRSSPKPVKAKRKSGRRVLGKTIRVDEAQAIARPHTETTETAEPETDRSVASSKPGESDSSQRLSKRERRRLRKQRQGN